MGPPEDPWPGAANRQFGTDFGGIFFLWHLVRALGLPEVAEDWNMPAALGPWALIEAIARVLVQPAEPELADPVWALLAELDGRGPEDPAGTDMAVPATIRVPATWLDPQAKRLRWHFGQGSLLLHDETGMPLVRCPSAPQSLAEVLSDARAACPGAVAIRSRGALAEPLPATGPFTAAFAAWLGWMVPPIGARLADALGCPRQEAAMVLRRQARIHTGPAEIDVAFDLDQADLPTRRAGLDLDPGWVPVLGHIVRFHYV